MSISINQAVKDILQALVKITLADSTVKYYGFCYHAVLQYCAENGKDHFSYGVSLGGELWMTFFTCLRRN